MPVLPHTGIKTNGFYFRPSRTRFTLHSFQESYTVLGRALDAVPTFSKFASCFYSPPAQPWRENPPCLPKALDLPARRNPDDSYGGNQNISGFELNVAPGFLILRIYVCV